MKVNKSSVCNKIAKLILEVYFAPRKIQKEGRTIMKITIEIRCLRDLLLKKFRFCLVKIMYKKAISPGIKLLNPANKIGGKVFIVWLTIIGKRPLIAADNSVNNSLCNSCFWRMFSLKIYSFTTNISPSVLPKFSGKYISLIIAGK